MKFHQLAAAAALSVAASGAFAAGYVLDLSSGSAGFSATPPAGGFSDTYTFTLTSAVTLNGLITSVVSGTQDIDFSSITLAGPAGLFSFTSVSGDPFETWTLGTGVLSAGAYSLTLVGLNSPGIASYAGNIAISPVPEPETFALMFAGLGALAFLSQRRSRQS